MIHLSLNTKGQNILQSIDGFRQQVINIRDSVRDLGEYRESYLVSNMLPEWEGALNILIRAISGASSSAKDELRNKNGLIRFVSRGIGTESGHCFVCGKDHRSYSGRGATHNISGYVSRKEDGEDIVNMFEQGARLDYRSKDYIQVKIHACNRHLPNLVGLDKHCKGELFDSISQEAADKFSDVYYADQDECLTWGFGKNRGEQIHYAQLVDCDSDHLNAILQQISTFEGHPCVEPIKKILTARGQSV